MSASTETKEQQQQQVSKWMAIVAKCRSRRGKWWRAEDERNYRTLHAGILDRLGPAPSPDDDIPVPVTSGVALAKLIRPWSTLSALQHTEGYILEDLLDRCQAAGRSYFGKDLQTGRRAWHPGTIAFLIIAQVIIAFLVGALLRLSENISLLDSRAMVYRMSLQIQDLSFPQLLGCSVTAIVVAGFFLLRQTKRY